MSGTTCRFCDSSDTEKICFGMVKYGVRHYAHWPCLIAAGYDRVAQLTDWQLGKMPFMLLERLTPEQQTEIKVRIEADAKQTRDYLARSGQAK